MPKRYIKGKDGKLQGSLPGAPRFPNEEGANTPKAPSETLVPAHPANGLIQGGTNDKRNTYLNVAADLDKANKAEQSSLNSLTEGFANIGEAFDIIEEIYAERLANSQAAYDKSKERLRIAEEDARSGKARYEALLLQRAEERKPINQIKRFLGIKIK